MDQYSPVEAVPSAAAHCEIFAVDSERSVAVDIRLPDFDLPAGRFIEGEEPPTAEALRRSPKRTANRDTIA
jgi:hypothetical protein